MAKIEGYIVTIKNPYAEGVHEGIKFFEKKIDAQRYAYNKKFASVHFAIIDKNKIKFY